MKQLEFLTQYEVESASACALVAKYFVETVCPVDTHHTDHRQIDAHTGSGGTLEVERRHVLHVGPCVSAFKEGETVDCGAWLQHEREVELGGETRVCVAVARAPWREHTIVVSTQSDGLLCVAV